jgi:hypothetical protein
MDRQAKVVRELPDKAYNYAFMLTALQHDQDSEARKDPDEMAARGRWEQKVCALSGHTKESLLDLLERNEWPVPLHAEWHTEERWKGMQCLKGSDEEDEKDHEASPPPAPRVICDCPYGKAIQRADESKEDLKTRGCQTLMATEWIPGHWIILHPYASQVGKVNPPIPICEDRTDHSE